MPAPDLSAPTLAIETWEDPVIDALGYPPRSTYVERFWLSILGPSTTWLVRHIDARLEEGPQGFTLELGPTAEALGLGSGRGRHSPLVRALHRACQFGVARAGGGPTLAVRRHLPPAHPPPDRPAPARGPHRPRRLAGHGARRRHPRRPASPGPPGGAGPGRAGRGRPHHRAAPPPLEGPPGGGPRGRGVGPPPGGGPRPRDRAPPAGGGRRRSAPPRPAPGPSAGLRPAAEPRLRSRAGSDEPADLGGDAA